MLDAFESILQGDIEHGVDLLVDFLSHSFPSEQEKVNIFFYKLEESYY